jgi:hypothetical protein
VDGTKRPTHPDTGERSTSATAVGVTEDLAGAPSKSRTVTPLTLPGITRSQALIGSSASRIAARGARTILAGTLAESVPAGGTLAPKTYENRRKEKYPTLLLTR